MKKERKEREKKIREKKEKKEEEYNIMKWYFKTYHTKKHLYILYKVLNNSKLNILKRYDTIIYKPLTNKMGFEKKMLKLMNKYEKNKLIPLSKKIKELYNKPETIPDEIKTRVASKIDETKTQLKNMYNSPGDQISLKKAGKWGAIQVVKAFLGMPIIPGR